MKSPHKRQLSTLAVTPTKPKCSSAKPSSWRKYYLGLIGARVVTGLDASELRCNLGIPSVVIPQEPCDILVGDLDLKRKTRRRLFDNLSALVTVLATIFLNGPARMPFSQTLSPSLGLGLQIGKLRELWSPVEIMTGLLAIATVERPTSEFAE